MNPLSFMQTHQVSTFEAMRLAQGTHELAAREVGFKKALDERTALEQVNVPEIPKSDALRTEERKGRDRRQQERNGQQETEEEAAAANPAGSGLDFLA